MWQRGHFVPGERVFVAALLACVGVVGVSGQPDAGIGGNFPTARHPNAVLRTGSARARPLVVCADTSRAGHDHLVAAHEAGAREPADVVDSPGTAEAVVAVSERVASDAAAGTGTSWHRAARGGWWAVASLLAGGRRSARAGPALRSDAQPRGDFLADRHDAMYREQTLSRVREVA